MLPLALARVHCQAACRTRARSSWR
jgi:hypothetical protein